MLPLLRTWLCIAKLAVHCADFHVFWYDWEWSPEMLWDYWIPKAEVCCTNKACCYRILYKTQGRMVLPWELSFAGPLVLLSLPQLFLLKRSGVERINRLSNRILDPYLRVMLYTEALYSLPMCWPTFRVLGFEGEITAVGACAKHSLPSWWNCLGSPRRLQKVAHLEKVGCYRQVLKDEHDPEPFHSLLPDAMRWIAFSLTTYSRFRGILLKQGWTIIEQTLETLSQDKPLLWDVNLRQLSQQWEQEMWRICKLLFPELVLFHRPYQWHLCPEPWVAGLWRCEDAVLCSQVRAPASADMWRGWARFYFPLLPLCFL